MAKSLFRRLLEQHASRHSPGSRGLSRYARAYLRNYDNEDNFDIAKNGEQALLRRLTPFAPRMVFDVGANLGVWSRAARGAFPDAVIHAFEINEALAREVAPGLNGIATLHPFGLADREGPVTLHVSPESSVVSSIVEGQIEGLLQTASVSTPARVRRGDAFCTEHGIEHIDILKLDVEGAEPSVLEGFRPLIERGAIDVIQFEYGIINVYTRFLLKDFYEALSDYAIGKLFTTGGVRFVDYHPHRETFRGPNFVAVRRSRSEIIAAVTAERW